MNPIKAFTKKRLVWVGIVSLALLAGLWTGYTWLVSPTRVLFVNFTDFQYADAAMNEKPFVRVDRASLEEPWIDRLSKYDLVFVFGKGLRLNGEQVMKIAGVGVRNKTEIFVYGGLTEEIAALTTLTGEKFRNVLHYIGYGGPVNMERLLAYSRAELDSKMFFIPETQDPLKIPNTGYFHVGDEDYFESLPEYDRFYSGTGRKKSSAPKVLVLISNLGPQSPNTRGPILDLITALEHYGYNVYPSMGFFDRNQRIKEVHPDAIIFVAHGRLAPGQPDSALAILDSLNIPLFAPVIHFGLYDEWLHEQRGVGGGMLGQNVVMPEFDGAIVPKAFGVQHLNDRGLKVFRGIDDQINDICEMVDYHLRLKDLPNKDKKLAIVYYKGPGRNALSATGLEVTASLLNLLRRLKAEGYTTGDLPPTPDSLFQIIQQRGRVIGRYALGATEEFLKEGQPALIHADTLSTWMHDELPPELIEAVAADFGPLPGENLSTSDSAGNQYVAVPRIEFGNIAILPQLISGKAESDAKEIAGKSPPTYPYVASYLWIRKAFAANALMHFGTYGSFEFLPKRQPPLSQFDWPDALLGPLPHLYLYCVESVGDALVAKRRGYATMISHLTPPFRKAELYGDLHTLRAKLDAFNGTQEGPLRERYRRTISQLVRKTGLYRDISLDWDTTTNLDNGGLREIESYVQTIAEETIHEGYYHLGEMYSDSQITTTVQAIIVPSLKHLLLTETSWDTSRVVRTAEKLIRDVIHNGRTPNAAADDLKHRITSDAVGEITASLIKARELAANLAESPENEMKAILNALSGGYTAPSPGGDPILNPTVVPTGRNMYGVNAEATPDEEAWRMGSDLAEQILQNRIRETGRFPVKIALTLWGGEFVRDAGATVAQVLKLLGARPVRNAMGIVHDIELIPCAELGRPRVDVVVQTSGQFRDIAASRLMLIRKAVELAASAEDTCVNFVRQGTIRMEADLKAKGYSPADARELSNVRIFGGVDGHYGAGIRELTQSGDKWNSSSDIAHTYLANMGAVYSDEHWGDVHEGLFEIALANTEMITQSVNSHITGPLALDNVWEFMGGLSAAIREVTGESPQGVFCDTRNSHNPQVRDAREMIWTEARASILNPQYTESMLESGSSALESFGEMFRNCFGWNSLAPEIVDGTMWRELNDMYVNDRYGLDLPGRFEDVNPYAFQEMTAVMLESIRKGFWSPGPAQTRKIAQLHADLVTKHKAGCSGHVCGNRALHAMVAGELDGARQQEYRDRIIEEITGRQGTKSESGIVLKKDNPLEAVLDDPVGRLVPVLLIILGVIGALLLGGYIRKRNE